ncbi:MAG: DNA internalization-related competence protein ComEC/Rec2 [Gemmatimonadota bacterium]|nr:MAG: DNA internalization-related competence protein ComEC/Rec2 [Gemmatimonadota bacterium]
MVATGRTAAMNRPALKLSLYFALGIILGHLVNPPILVLLTLDALLFLIAITIFLTKKSVGKWNPALYIVLVITVSSLHYELRTSDFSPRHVSNFLRKATSTGIVGQIASLPECDEERTTFTLSVKGIATAHEWRRAEGKVRVTMGERTDRFSYGDVIRFDARLEEPDGLRNPGGFDYKAYLNRRSIYGLIFLRGVNNVEIIERRGGTPFLSALIWPIRKSMRRTIERNLTGPPEALLKGILLGERRNIPESIEEIFRDSGVIHVLAVSGLHVGLVVFIFFNLFRVFRLSFNWAVVCTLGILFLYIFVTGSRAPVVRASLMAAVVLTGLILEKNVDLLNTLAFAGLFILLFSPQALFDPGFQLSFAAVLSIVYAYPRLKEWLPLFLRRQHTWWRRWLLGGSLVSLSAQMGIAPIVAYYFYRVPVVSVLANVIVVPWVGLILSLGFAASLFGPFSSDIGLLFNASNWLALTGLIHTVTFFASLPFSTLSVPQPSLPVVLGCYCVTGLLVNVKRIGRAGHWLIITLLVAANCWIWTYAVRGNQNELVVTFFDVGQGDAIFLRTPQGKTLLIDGGRRSRYYDCGKRVLEPYLRQSGIRRVDGVLLTHPHSDHLGGLLAVLENFHVGQVMDSGLQHGSTLYEEYVTLIEERGIPRRIMRAGDRIDEFHPLRIMILHPTDSFVSPDGWAPYGLNNGSITARLDYGRVSFLFLGDVEAEADRALLKRKGFLKATVVKVPHQGSITGSSRRLVEAIQPCVAVISVSEGNRFGHPADAVVRRYEQCGARIYRTDEDGAIIIRTNGERTSIRTMIRSE